MQYGKFRMISFKASALSFGDTYLAKHRYERTKGRIYRYIKRSHDDLKYRKEVSIVSLLKKAA